MSVLSSSIKREIIVFVFLLLLFCVACTAQRGLEVEWPARIFPTYMQYIIYKEVCNRLTAILPLSVRRLYDRIIVMKQSAVTAHNDYSR